MRSIEDIRRSNEAAIAALDRVIVKRQEILQQYQQLNQEAATYFPLTTRTQRAKYRSYRIGAWDSVRPVA